MANSYQVTLTWPSYPNQGTITNLVVRRDSVIIATLPASATSFLDDGTTVAGVLLPGVEYIYSVTVVFNNSCPARALNAIVDMGCYANDATNVILTDNGAGSVTVSWFPPGTSLPFYGYTVSWGTVNGGPYPNSQVVIDPLALSSIVTGLTIGTPYYFTVRGMDAIACLSAGDNQQTITPA